MSRSALAPMLLGHQHARRDDKMRSARHVRCQDRGVEYGSREGDHESLVEELRSLRGRRGPLDVAVFATCPTLVRLCGDGDLLDGYLVFKGELDRWSHGRRDEAAYALSVLDDSDTVLQRLDAAAGRLPGAEGADQRTIRRWGDDAIPGLAAELLVLAESAGRRGRTLIRLEAADGPVGSLTVTVDVMNPVDLHAREPLIHALRFRPDGEPYETEFRIASSSGIEALGPEYAMSRFVISLPPLVEADKRDEEMLLFQLDVQLPDAPTVSCQFRDLTSDSDALFIEFLAFRSACQLTVHTKANIGAAE